MKKIICILVVVLISSSSFTALHKFYVSVKQIDYNDKEKSLQIISRIFIDDFEEVLQERYDASLELTTENEDGKADTYINTYLHQKITILVNEEEVTFKFLGKEYEDDLMLCYLEVENVTSLQSVSISNTVLMDIFEEQQNIVHVKKGEIRKSLILEKEKDEGVLKFSE